MAAAEQPRLILLASPASAYTYVVALSASVPGMWQLTCLDADGQPYGHTNYYTADQAEAQACGRFVDGQPPVGDRTYRRAFPCSCCSIPVLEGEKVCPECGGDPAADELECEECRGEGTLSYALPILTRYGVRSSPWDEETGTCFKCRGQRTIETPYALEREQAIKRAGPPCLLIAQVDARAAAIEAFLSKGEPTDAPA